MVHEKRDWSKVDWTQQDVAIAAMMGVTREAVRQQRPADTIATRHHKWTAETAYSRIAEMDTSRMTPGEIAKEIGCSIGYVYTIIASLKKECKQSPRGKVVYNWDLLPENWQEMTDGQIAEIVGVKNRSIVSLWRNRKGYHRPGYTKREYRKRNRSETST